MMVHYSTHYVLISKLCFLTKISGFITIVPNSIKTECFHLAVGCSTGEYIKDHVCVKCLVGYYQDLPAQTSCKGCPDGYTTSDTGTVTATECSGGC